MSEKDTKLWAEFALLAGLTLLLTSIIDSIATNRAPGKVAWVALIFANIFVWVGLAVHVAVDSHAYPGFLNALAVCGFIYAIALAIAIGQRVAHWVTG